MAMPRGDAPWRCCGRSERVVCNALRNAWAVCMSATAPSGATSFPQESYFTMSRKVYLVTKLQAETPSLPDKGRPPRVFLSADKAPLPDKPQPLPPFLSRHHRGISTPLTASASCAKTSLWSEQ